MQQKNIYDKKIDPIEKINKTKDSEKHAGFQSKEIKFQLEHRQHIDK